MRPTQLAWWAVADEMAASASHVAAADAVIALATYRHEVREVIAGAVSGDLVAGAAHSSISAGHRVRMACDVLDQTMGAGEAPAAAPNDHPLLEAARRAWRVHKLAAVPSAATSADAADGDLLAAVAALDERRRREVPQHPGAVGLHDAEVDVLVGPALAVLAAAGLGGGVVEEELADEAGAGGAARAVEMEPDKGRLRRWERLREGRDAPRDIYGDDLAPELRARLPTRG